MEIKFTSGLSTALPSKKKINQFIYTGLFFAILGIFLLFAPFTNLKNTLICDENNMCSYTSSNIGGDVTGTSEFNLNDVYDVRINIYVNDYDRHFRFNSREENSSYKLALAQEYTDKRLINDGNKKMPMYLNKKKINVSTYYDICINNGKKSFIEISSEDLFNKFRKYYFDRRNGIIEPNAKFYYSKIDTKLILALLFTSFFGLFVMLYCIKLKSRLKLKEMSPETSQKTSQETSQNSIYDIYE